MRGTSADSRAAVVRRLEGLLDSDGVDAGRLGTDLFAVAALLDAEPRLRRAVTDPASDPDAKVRLVRAILAGRLSDAAVDVAAEAVRHRWSAGRDLADTLEYAGVVAEVSAAEQAGQADELEDELFRFGRVVVGDRGLRRTLDDRRVAVERKRALVRGLLEDRATPASVRLVEQAAAGRQRSFAVALEEFQELAAARRHRLVATVRAAQPLPEHDKQRLADALARQYGRAVHLNVVVDPTLLGGLRVEIGDDVIDGTVSSRLDDARRRLAG
ncbi:MAG: F0F1 ATP synthase subunit delta [Actinomycetota bacterium]|nr:F0F1 ATP synthase subunit delta [Actinomycetota bacterium]